MAIAGLDGFVAQKYAILGRQADAANTDANARANLAGHQGGLIDQQARQVAPNSEAEQGLERAQAGQASAQAGYLGVEGNVAGYDLSHPVTYDQGLQLHGALSQQSLTGGIGGGIGAPASSAGGNINLDPTHGGTVVYATGTPKVPGKDQGKDTVHAMLRPREAVLVPGAADAIGRDKIAALNAVHNAKDEASKKLPADAGKGVGPEGRPLPMPQKGAKPAGKAPMPVEKDCTGSAMVGYDRGTPYVPGLNNGTSSQGAAGPGSTVTSGQWGNGQATPVADLRASMGMGVPRVVAKPQNFAKGTHEVGHGKSAKTPSIKPGVLQALIGGGMGGGMGMGAPGGAPAMPGQPPMPMPPGRGMV